MVPQSFIPFFAASTGAGAALVGLLFVAVSIAPEHIVASGAPIERQALAASTFTAMVNAFFVSIAALIPGDGLALVTLIIGASSIMASLTLGFHLLRRQRSWIGVARSLFLVIVGLVIYGYEFAYALVLLHDPQNIGAIFFLSAILIGVYGLGLARAWQLLGAQRFGFFGWFNILNELSTPGRDSGPPSTNPPTSAHTTQEPSAPR